MAEIKIKQLQTAIFLKNFSIPGGYEKLDLVSKLRKEVGDIFDGDPTILPIPDDAPSDIPRLVLKSENKIYSSRISPVRIDIFSNFDSNNEQQNLEMEAIFNNQKNNSNKIIESLKLENKFVFRIGFSVVCEITNINSGFLKKVKDKYIKLDVDDLKEFSITLNKNLEFKGNPLNDIFIVSSDNSSLVLSLDINTATSQDFTISESGLLAEFMNYAAEIEIGKIRDFENFIS